MSDLLRVLSDSDLLARTRELASLERVVTLRLLLHLNEIERRQLHLEQGYSSMFDYCTSGLGYSEPAAARRLRTARCMTRFPEILQLLRANEVNLSTISRVANVLSADNKDHLLARIRSKSRRAVDAIIAEYQPLAKKPHDVIQPVAIRASSTKLEIIVPLQLETRRAEDPHVVSHAEVTPRPGHCEKSDYCRGDSDGAPVVAAEPYVRFRFSARQAFEKKIDKVKSLAWHRLPANPSLENVFELVLDAFIEKHDPVVRHERRAKRAKREAEATMRANSSEKAPERFIPAAIRDEVFARDGSRCAFVAPDGRRCNSTLGLQVDHVVPVAHGGASTLDNLRLLCAHHNRFEAEQVMGRHGPSRP